MKPFGWMETALMVALHVVLLVVGSVQCDSKVRKLFVFGPVPAKNQLLTSSIDLPVRLTTLSS